MDDTSSQVATTALEGVRVLDLSQFEAGPSCTQMLAWLGAEVIKVERPVLGEQGRQATVDTPGIDPYYFMLLNMNKKSVALDLKRPEGREILDDLLRECDVFIENFRPGGIESMGFSWERVHELNPRIIYAQVKGYAPQSRYAEFPSFDTVAQAVGGLVSVTGYAGQEPVKPGPSVADAGSGLHLAIGILAALHQRSTTGLGQRVQVAMQEAVINLCRMGYAAQLLTDKPAPRTGNQSQLGTASPSGMYPTAPFGENDYVSIYVSRVDNKQWQRLLDVMGREDLKEDPRFGSPEARGAHADDIDAIVTEWSRTVTKREAMDLLGAANVPGGAVFDTVELSEDEDLNRSGAFVTVDHPQRGPVRVPGFPVRLSGSMVPIVPSPLLGQHSDEVLTELLGLSEERVAVLRESGVLA